MQASALSSLDDALTLRLLGPGEWQGRADPRYEAGTGMYGGWTAALLLRSVIDDARAQGIASAITVHYLKRIAPGSDVRLRTRLLGASRSIAFWQSELQAVGEEEVNAQATVVITQRKPSDGFTEFSMPRTPEPDALPQDHPPGPFGERTIVRRATGTATFDQPTTQSVTWVRELSGRAIDHLQLAYLSDAFAPRIFLKSPGLRPSSTITLSIYFYAADEELRPLGDDYILSEITGTRAEQSIVGSQVRLWSRSGTLLATSEQLCWFK
jgi:acyl-CoA thioesterase